MNLQEAGTFQAQRQGEQWFRKLPSDNRFVKVTDVRFDPQTTLNGATKIKFVLPAQTEGSVYLMHQHFLSVKLRMVQSDGTAIKNIGAGTMKDPKRMPLIAPANNILHTLFEGASVYMGKTLVNPTTKSYPFKAYLNTLLSFNSEAKSTWLEQEGWYEDSDRSFEFPKLTASNIGFINRRNLFANDAHSELTTKLVSFTGRLNLDLESMTCGIPPGLEITIDLEYSKNEFRLVCGEKDWNLADDVVLEVVECTLWVPVGDLHPKVWNHVEAKLKSKENIMIHFYRTGVDVKTIPIGTNNFITEIFATAADIPTRIFMFVLNNARLNGNIKANPFLMQRKFDKYDAAWKNVLSSIYIKQVDISLNGVDISGFNEQATIYEDPVNYHRFTKVMGLSNRNLGCEVSILKFMDNTWMASFDLTTAKQPANDYVIPTIRRGALKLRMNFSEPTKEELSLVVVSEYPSLCSIDEKRNVLFSYFSSLH